MTQKIKKVNINFLSVPWKKKSWWSFFILHFIALFILVYGFLGLTLWFQSLLISALLIAGFSWIFSQIIKTTFKESTSLKGYDPWHLRPLLNQWLPHTHVQILNNETPLCFQYELYGSSHLILSPSLLSHFKKDELIHLLKFQQLYFKKGFARFFTQLTYIVFVVSSPLVLLSILFKKIRLPFFQKVLDKTCQYSLWLPFSIVSRLKFFKLDQQASQIFGKDIYCHLLQKLQTYSKVSSFNYPLVLSCLFLTHPKAVSHSSFHMQPSAQNRIKKLINRPVP